MIHYLSITLTHATTITRIILHFLVFSAVVKIFANEAAQRKSATFVGATGIRCFSKETTHHP